MTPRQYGIIDSTLREGEQAPGTNFSGADRKAIIRLLHKVGVDEIELGIASPVNSHLPELAADAGKITGGDCRIGLWCRCRDEDIAFAAECGPDVLSLSMPVSDLHIKERLQKDRAWVKQTLARSIQQGLALGIPYISVGLEDGSRADPDFLLEIAAVAEKNGAARIRLADTVGICSPARIQQLIGLLKNSVGLEVGVHCHNDFGMATANSIAALESGATWLDATVLGLGERAGNCRLEEVVGFLTLRKNNWKYQSGCLAELCRYVAGATGIAIQGSHPIVGENIFTCETGLHQHGLSINPDTYEPYEPHLVGTERKLRFGRKTGKGAIRLQLAGQGLRLSEQQAGHLAACLRTGDKSLSNEQLLNFAAGIID